MKQLGCIDFTQCDLETSDIEAEVKKNNIQSAAIQEREEIHPKKQIDVGISSKTASRLHHS
jgi:hypothetical protein